MYLMVSKIFTRKNTLTVLFVLIYLFVMIRSIWWGYDTVGLLWATLWSHIVLVLLLTLWIIEWQDELHQPHFLKVVWIVVFVFCLAAATQGVWKLFGIVSWNAAYLLYSFLTRIAITNQKKVSLWVVSVNGLSTLSTLLSIGYVMMFLSYARPFDIDCANLKQQTLGIFTQYFPQSNTGSAFVADKIVATIDTLKNNTLWQLVGVVGSWWQSLDLTWSSSIAQTWTLLSTVEHYKKVLIDDFVSNKSIIDQWACDFTLSQIQKISTNSTVQISAVILLTLLILVFLNTLFIIVGIIIFLILLALYSMWFYRSKYISETVEKLEW